MSALGGVHHLGLTVSDVERSARWYHRPELDRWCRRLADHGVDHAPVAAARSIPNALVVVFRDPDDIQLELFLEE
jgi:catechol 2,3-dioxygenase-like lactoylglutathione lyase family enzyme